MRFHPGPAPYFNISPVGPFLDMALPTPLAMLEGVLPPLGADWEARVRCWLSRRPINPIGMPTPVPKGRVLQFEGVEFAGQTDLLTPQQYTYPRNLDPQY